ncbi:MAG: 4-deoxy-4-formamido-L-arabinose-phosphoundecaprenol deformylase [Deltaproteobacteria bacterium]|nr:4-deoxy-4-formamido-L-arabinose-phosphoundecaprenol deformylase [Deltaproteobacteria bacterium]
MKNLSETLLGLRIDADTYRGTKIGIPNLQKVLLPHQIAASFFFSVGPDNMGRHIKKLLKPGFLKKMLRSNAPNLYGWDILLKGTILPGPVIGKKCSDIIRSVALDGHETGLHAWDHHQWQTRILKMSREHISNTLRKGCESLEVITGKRPTCSAAPGWTCNNDVLEVKENFSFFYNSDTRGSHIFFPVVNNKVLTCPQIPVTLPTYDEIIGRCGLSQANYNAYLLSLIQPGRLNVLTIHAEAEGIHCLDLFKNFIKQALARGICILPLGNLLDKFPLRDTCSIIEKKIDGRHGRIAFQSMKNEN